jgi:hypothetical protein
LRATVAFMLCRCVTLRQAWYDHDGPPFSPLVMRHPRPPRRAYPPTHPPTPHHRQIPVLCAYLGDDLPPNLKVKGLGLATAYEVGLRFGEEGFPSCVRTLGTTCPPT